MFFMYKNIISPFFKIKKISNKKNQEKPRPFYAGSALPAAAPVLAVLTVLAVFPPKIVDQSLGGGVTGSISVASVAMLVGSWFCC